uniref:P/Homo B domain-containing protein n=1 Tax=Trichobilharzia regenti TaxID=157069 RepID=A0AA85JVQ5_TRIRE|nr:unnamed protein product [Trichobilharzia regenti]
MHSQLYGYGLMDAGKMVRLGELWRGVPPHHRCTSNVIDVQKNLGGKFNHTLFLNFSGCQPKTQDNESLNKLNKSTSENGTPIRIWNIGLLRLSVISPSGTLSVLLPPRIHDEHSGNIAMLRWPVTTVQFWGESAIGTWQIRLDSILGTEISRVDPDNIKGFWRSVWIVAYGTDEFPIRLKPPSPSRPPPPEWFESFAEYVVDDQHWHKVYTCHSECVPGGCTGPAADQCLYGCKTFATESRQCVSVCPPGTTAFGALRLSNSLNNYANANKNNNNNNNGQKSRDRVKPEAMLSSSGARIRSSAEGYPLGVNDDPLQINGNNQQGFKNEMVCQPCWSLCSACIRPHIEYDCTACSNQRFLIIMGKLTRMEIIKNNNNNVYLENAKHLNFNLPQVIGTCRTECPAGFFGNKSTSICESCAENCARCVGSKSDECRECYPGFRLIHGRCVDSTSADGRCKPGQYLKHSECVNCHPSCDKAGCVTSNQCNWCPSHLPNYFNGTCTKSCPEGWYSGVQIRPPFHSNIQDQVSSVVKQPSVQMCEPCSPGCQKCINFSLCEVCLPYLMLHNGTCILPEDNTTNVNITPTLVNKSNSQVNSKLLGIPSNQCGSVSCSTCYGDYYLLEITLFNALQNVDIFNGNSIIINNNNKNNKNNNNISSTTALSSSSLSTSSTSSSPSTTTTQLNQIHYPVNNISSVYTDTSITELTPLMSTTKSMPTDTSTTSTTRTPTSTTTLTTTDDNVVKSFSLLKRTMKNKGVLISRRFVVHTNSVNNHISNSLNLSYPKFICVHICPTGYYVKRISVGENEITMCSKCPPSCSSCTDISHCNACQTGFYLDKKSNHCLLRTVCRFSEYFDEDKGICRPCDPNCRTCSGPRSYQCTSCNRKPPVPRCLLTNQRVSKLHRTSKDLAIWPPDQLSVEPNSGQCLVCCPYRLALTSRDPRQCMFCVADKLVCLSGDEIGAGESGYILEEVNKKHQSLWELFTKEPSRLVLFIICLIIITVLLIFILVHFILSRRRYRHYYHQHCPTAAAAASVYCPCCRRHVSVPGSGGNDESEGKRSKQIVTSVTKKRKARQLAHLNNNNNSNNNRRHNRHPTNPPNGGNTEHGGGGGDDEDDYDYDVDDIRAEQISLRSKMNNKDNNISFIDKFITDRGELNNDSAIATTDMTPTITTTGINTTTSSDNNNNSNNNNSYTPYYKSSICSSNGNLHSGRVHRLSTEETINSHIPPPCIIISSTPQSIATAIPLNSTNPHHHQYIRYNQLSSKDDNNGEKLISDTTTESSLSTTEAVNT